MTRSTKQRLGREDWVEAALGALASGGVRAIAVEPLAAALGATKGSFYWHFDNRDALVEAALDAWEERWTDRVIAHLEHEAGPLEALRELFRSAFDLDEQARATELALLASLDHPAVRRAVRRVSQRRITYMAELLEGAGWPAAEALDRAVLVAYLYVGFLQTTHVAPRAVSADDRRRYVELAFETVVRRGA